MVGMSLNLADVFGSVVGVGRVKFEETERRLVMALAGVKDHDGLLHFAVEMILDDVDTKQRVQSLDIGEE
jgi:hypothetical protein